ncbi:FHA domain-containing protein [Psychrobacter frigidicola]|uniref:FHA domain-containing protein n=1 Tax=Psychrobacter frigidicola TaxID=45611 RepID=UPI001D1113D0|nr:FHA domain-containing protein [Psychrobacter frigidicola]
MSNSNEHDTTSVGTNITDIKVPVESNTWQLNALTEALGDLTLTVSDSLSVGRGSDNDVVLGSKQVSRNHALLSVLNGKLYLKDLNSSNGTFINEERIEGNKSKHLKADDTVGFASFAFQVMAGTSDAMDAPTDIEQPVETAAALTHTAPTTIDVLPTEVVDAEVVDGDVVDSEVIDSIVLDTKVVDTDIIDAEVVNNDVMDDTTLPIVTADEVLESSEKRHSDDVAATLDEPAIRLEAQPAASSPVEPVVVEETVLDSMILNDTTLDTPTLSTPTLEDTSALNMTTENDVHKNIGKPVVKETIIKEVLSSSESLDHTPTKATQALPTTSAMPSTADKLEPIVSKENLKENLHQEEMTNSSLINESLVNEPMINEPLEKVPTAPQEPAMQQEPIVTPEQDKTTKTALQEEADPDVLRAKQAATGQFSGTTNLGQSRDVGTEGNNAMDQAIDNTANAGHVEKKPSGGWFIWVFVAIIIIGIALWLFNMGGA